MDVFWDGCEGPITFGVNDCCMVTADVILAAGGPDLMAPYRGRYASARGFVRAFRRAGHQTLPAASLAMLQEKGREVFDPRNFDVAVVAYFDKSLEKPSVSPGIFHSGFWHVRTDKGAMVLADGASLIHRVI
jgi:hypothetical protein